MFTATAQRWVQRLLWVMAFLCLWCSSVGTLHHTDDFSADRVFAAGQMHTAPLHLAPPPDVCAAHTWEQTVPTLVTRVVAVKQPVFFLASLTPCLLPALHLHCFDYAPLRAPPLSLS